MEELKLVALDKDDIEIVSAHVQDALVKVADILWQPREHRFVMALNRFDWMNAADARGAKNPDDAGGLPTLPHGAAVRARQCLQVPRSRSRWTRTLCSICSRSNSSSAIRLPAL